MIENIDPELAATVATAIVGIVEAARRFQDTGKIPYTQLPWAAKREIFKWLRKSYFTVDKPDGEPSFVVEKSRQEVHDTLAKQGFIPEWPLAYVYGGEVLNMAQYVYDPTQRLPHRQIHVRAFEHPDGLELLVHSEPSAIHHPEEHLESGNRTHESAHDYVRERLENSAPVDYPSN